MTTVRFSSRRVRALAERAVDPALTVGVRDARRLDEQLDASDGDRVAYDRLVRLHRVLEGGDATIETLTTAQKARAFDRILEQAAVEPPRRWAIGMLAPLAAGLALVLGVALLWSTLRPPTDDGGFQARGAVGSAIAGGKAGIGAHCVRAGAVVTPPARTPDAPVDARCVLGDELQLTVTHDAGFSHLLVVGDLVDEATAQHTSTWYFPAPPTGRSGPAPQRADDEALGASVRLHINHRPGLLRLLAVFSHEPIAAARVFERLRAPDAAELSARELAEALGDDITLVERRIQIAGGTP